MEGIAKFCDLCGKQDFLFVWETDDGKDANGLTKEQNENCMKLPASLRGLYRRQLDPYDFDARLEWINLIYNGDPRIRPLDLDRVVCVRMYKKLYEDSECGEAAYMLGRCFEKGIERRSTFESDVGRDIDGAYECYQNAAAAGYGEAYLALARLVEENCSTSYRVDGWHYYASKQIPADLNAAAYYALMAIAMNVKGARERYEDLKRRGFPGGQYLAVFRASYPNVKI